MENSEPIKKTFLHVKSKKKNYFSFVLNSYYNDGKRLSIRKN